MSENRLRTYFENHHVGPGIWKWTHYFDAYERHFARFVGREVHVVEIGVYSGGSLGMWRDYFGPGCQVYGVDIEPACRAYEGDGTKIFIGDQADRSFWAGFREQVPHVDIVIDDGGHLPEQQIVTLEETLPHLRPGGVYFCEDVHGSTNEFASYVHGLSRNLNEGSAERSPFQQAVDSIHLYPFAVVIERHAASPGPLSAPRHGTEWQPFLGPPAESR